MLGGATCAYLAASKHRFAETFRSEYGIGGIVLNDAWMEPLSTELNQGSFVHCPYPLLAMHADLFQWKNNLELQTTYIQRVSEFTLELEIVDSGHMLYADGNNPFTFFAMLMIQVCFACIVGAVAPIVTAMLKSTGRREPVDLLAVINELTARAIAAFVAEKSDQDERARKVSSIHELLARHSSDFKVLSFKETSN